MAQWLARGIAVVGFAALGWTSFGDGPPAPPVQAHHRRPPDRRRRRCSIGGNGPGWSRRWPGSRCASKPTAASSPSAIRFAARGTGYGVALTATGATLSLTSPTATTAVAMTVVGRDGRPAVARRVDGREPLAGVVNHYIGDDPRRWQVGVAAVRAGAPVRRLRGHRPRVLRQPGAPRIRLPGRAGRRSVGDPGALRRRRPRRDRRRTAICWSTPATASRCGSRRRSAIR